MISAGIGGVWKFDEELAPLIPFLFAEASAGRLALGGIDDQVGGFQQAYANDEMPAELTSYLPAGRRAECREILRQRIRYDFPAPYAQAGRARVLRCLAEIGAALRQNRRTDRRTRDDLIEMAASFERSLARDFMETDAFLRAREPSLYANFRWLAGRLPPRSRIIVWGATSHIARDAGMMRRYAGARNFGSFIHEAYGPRAFALGFSAFSGAYRAFGGARDDNVETLTPAAATSLEGRAMAGTGADAVYLGAAALARLGIVQGSAFFHEPLTADWSRLLDGIVIFREQRPTRRNPRR
jgi:erythromycin esterase-like protein